MQSTPNYEYKKYAEVYEFYAGYKRPETSGGLVNEKRYSLGTLVNAGKSNGYSGSNKIDGEDLHYGWEQFLSVRSSFPFYKQQ